MGFGKIVAKAMQMGIIKVANSTPIPVDVSAAGMAMQTKKIKTLKGARGTGVTYSGVRTSSQGLLTGANTEKKTLLGG
jgi:hypothetical protein